MVLREILILNGLFTQRGEEAIDINRVAPIYKDLQAEVKLFLR